MLFNVIVCPSCQSTNIGRHGLSAEGKTRYKCRNTECKRCTFILNYTYQGYLPQVKEKITDMAMNGNCRVINDEAFLRLKELLEPFGITQYYTDGWGAYERHIEPALHSVGKCNTQKIERKHLTLRTRIKRLARKTICFSKSIVMHDIVLGLFINRFEFGCLI